MITNKQLRAARCLMALSRAEVARRSGLGFGTIGKLEHYGAAPENGSLAKLVAMYESFGLRFLGTEGVTLQCDDRHDTHRERGLTTAEQAAA
jgi:transcriptional regulator with XRE-family HTH domain